jgi:hypothetical protein
VCVIAKAEQENEAHLTSFSEDEEYDPGWLGTVLRWPLRIVAVLIILPTQIAWESLKALAWFFYKRIRRFARFALAHLAYLAHLARFAEVPMRALRALLRALQALTVATVHGALRLARPIARATDWLLNQLTSGTGRLAILLAGGIGLLLKAAIDSTRAIRTAGGRRLLQILRVLGQIAIIALALVLVPPLYLMRCCLRGYRRIRPLLHAAAHQLLKALAKTAALAIRGLRTTFRLLGYGLTQLFRLLRLLTHWTIGLCQVLAEAIAVGFRVGRKVGRGAVWLWTTVVWNPLSHLTAGLWSGAKWVGRGIRTIWLAWWRPAHRIWRRLTAAPRRLLRRIASAVGTAAIAATVTAKEITTGIKTKLATTHHWYRQQISAPIAEAVRSARRDVRQALTRRRQDT